METITTVVKDVINSLNNNLNKDNTESMDTITQKTHFKGIDSDFSDDSIDPQIEYDLIINENSGEFSSLFTTTIITDVSIETIEDKFDNNPEDKHLKESAPTQTSNEMITDSVCDRDDDKSEENQSSQEIPIETTTEVTVDYIEGKGDDNMVQNKDNNSSGVQKVDPIVNACDKNQYNSLTDELINDSKTKTPKKSNKKKSKAKKDNNSSKSNSTPKMSIESSNKTSDERSWHKNKKKSTLKRPKSDDKKYQMKKRSEMSEELFGKISDKSTEDKTGKDSNFESLYTKQCEEWFRRETRHKKYDFSQQSVSSEWIVSHIRTINLIINKSFEL